MDNKEINILVDRTMNSIEGIERAGTDQFDMDNIKKRISRRKGINERAGYMWKLAAVFVVLICVNVFSIMNYLRTTSEDTRTAAIKTLADEYLLTYTTYNY